jgi:hypothetical protein
MIKIDSGKKIYILMYLSNIFIKYACKKYTFVLVNELNDNFNKINQLDKENNTLYLN